MKFQSTIHKVRAITSRIGHYSKEHPVYTVVISLFILANLHLLAVHAISAYHAHQLNNAQQQLTTLQKQLDGAPKPQYIQLKQKASGASEYIQNIQTHNDTIQEQRISLPPASTLNSKLAYPYNLKIESAAKYETATTVKNTEAINTHISEFIEYHTGVIKALSKFFEYIPEADMVNYQPGSKDTKKRIQKAHDGLNEAINQLKSLDGNYPDQQLNTDIKQLESVLQELNKLEASHNTKRWINHVTKAQKKIKQNRVKFWNSELTKYQQRINQLKLDLNQLQDIWQAI